MIYVTERAENHRLLLTHDPRTETEKLTAYKILQLARPDHLLNGNYIKFDNYKDRIKTGRLEWRYNSDYTKTEDYIVISHPRYPLARYFF